MTARERIEKLIYSIAVADGFGPTHTDDWRQIDQLLVDCAHYFLGHGLEDQETKLYERLAQAGYGEK